MTNDNKIRIEMASMLKKLILKKGISEVILHIDFCHESDVYKDNKNKIKKSLKKKSDTSYTSNVNVCSVRGTEEYLQNSKIIVNKNYNKNHNKNLTNWHSNTLSIHNSNTDIKDELKVISYQFRCLRNNNYIIRFDFILENFDLNIVIDEESIINAYYRILFKYRTFINPWIRYGVINQKSVSVLDLLSRGVSRGEIGETLFISPRGVDYYSSLLKSVFHANNLIELISKTKDAGII
jgi:DNA-binding CsgD family transcriptional regulator